MSRAADSKMYEIKTIAEPSKMLQFIPLLSALYTRQLTILLLLNETTHNFFRLIFFFLSLLYKDVADNAYNMYTV